MRRRIEIIGNMTGDATIYTPQNNVNNRVCINFNVAVNEKFKDKNGNVTEKAFFYPCALWRSKDNVKIAEYLKKGVLVLVEGLPEAQIYTDKEGKQIPQLKIEVKDVRLLSGIKKGSEQPSEENEDLPF